MDTFADQPKHGRTPLDQPFFWRVADGVLYAEMPYSTSIRPPLLTQWESERAKSFNNPQRRNQWLAGRALAKALVRERLGIPGIVEIREGASGEPLVYRNGLPMPHVWLGMGYRHGRVAAVIADRPVALDIRRVEDGSAEVVSRFVGRAEFRILRKVFRGLPLACSVAWAIKEAAIRAARGGDHPDGLLNAKVLPDFGVSVGDVRMHTLALRVVDETVVAIVGRPLLHEKPVTRIVMSDAPSTATDEQVALSIDRSVARARRVAEARARWHRLRWQT